MRLKLIAAALVLALTACGQQEAPPALATDAAPAPAATPADTAGADTAAPAEPVAEVSTNIMFSPANLSNCDVQPLMVSWNLAGRGIKSVKIHFMGSDGQEKLFAWNSPVDSKETGNWGRAGLVFIARHPDTGEELSRAVVPGPDCSTPTPSATP